MFVIDGGLCKAYHNTTGIAGYTLISTSRGITFKAHTPFESCEKAVAENVDINSDVTLVEKFDERRLVADTDNGIKIRTTIKELEALLHAYVTGTIAEKTQH